MEDKTTGGFVGKKPVLMERNPDFFQ